MTGAMTSLTGASGEDFASILRSLGYRMEKRPRPKESRNARKNREVSESAPATAAEATSHRRRRRPLRGRAAEETAGGGRTADGRRAAETAEPLRRLRPKADPPVELTRLRLSRAQNPKMQSPGFRGGRPPDSAAAIEAEMGSAEPTPAAPAEPEMIEVWRPGRPPGERRARDGERRRRRRQRRACCRSACAQPPPWAKAPLLASGGASGSGARPKRHRKRNPTPGQRHASAGTSRASAASPTARTAGRWGSPRTSCRTVPDVARKSPTATQGRAFGSSRGRDRRAAIASATAAMTTGRRAPGARAPEPRDKAPDPNSPFAKLAGAQGAARGGQGAALSHRQIGPPAHRQMAMARARGAHALGCGGACRAPVMCASTASASTPRAARCGRATW